MGRHPRPASHTRTVPPYNPAMTTPTSPSPPIAGDSWPNFWPWAWAPCLGRAGTLGTGGIPQPLAAKECGRQLGPRGLESRVARRRTAATLPRDCRSLGRLERLSGRGRRQRFSSVGQRWQVSRVASDLSSNGGCVAYDAEKKNFYCPSHGACSSRGRGLDPKSVSPRDLDTLEVEIRDGTEVWVKFERFQDGKSQKILKT